MPLGPKVAQPQVSPGTWSAFNRYLYITQVCDLGPLGPLVFLSNISFLNPKGMLLETVIKIDEVSQIYLCLASVLKMEVRILSFYCIIFFTG